MHVDELFAVDKPRRLTNDLEIFPWIDIICKGEKKVKKIKLCALVMMGLVAGMAIAEVPDPAAASACAGNASGYKYVPIQIESDFCNTSITFNVYECTGGGGRYLTTTTLIVSRPQCEII